MKLLRSWLSQIKSQESRNTKRCRAWAASFGYINILNITVVKRALSGVLFKNPAEICLVVVSHSFPNLAYRQLWIVKKELTGFIDPQINNIFGRSTVIYLAKYFCEIAGAVIHTACD